MRMEPMSDMGILMILTVYLGFMVGFFCMFNKLTRSVQRIADRLDKISCIHEGSK